jgi:fructose-1,6-bisphosphatase
MGLVIRRRRSQLTGADLVAKGRDRHAAAFFAFGAQPRIVVKIQHMETTNTPNRKID